MLPHFKTGAHKKPKFGQISHFLTPVNTGKAVGKVSELQLSATIVLKLKFLDFPSVATF